MIQILGPRRCQERIVPHPTMTGVNYIVGQGLDIAYCQTIEAAQDPRAVSVILGELQSAVPLGWLGDYDILCPRQMILDVFNYQVMGTADGQRFDGWIVLSGHDYPLQDRLAHELGHEIDARFVGAERTAFLALAGWPPGDPRGLWEEQPRELSTELVCLALWGQPLDERMVMRYGQPGAAAPLAEWLKNRIGDHAKAPVTAVDGNRIVLQIGNTQAEVNGQAVTIDAPPVLRGGRTFLPFRFLGESLGATVNWNDTTKRAVYERDGAVLQVEPGSTLAWVNGQPQTVDAAPFIENARTMVPLRWVAEQLQFSVHWDGTTQTITITR